MCGKDGWFVISIFCLTEVKLPNSIEFQVRRDRIETFLSFYASLVQDNHCGDRCFSNHPGGPVRLPILGSLLI